MEFINREEEIKYLKAHFEKEPNSLLFVYGPKSSGKSTFLEKVVTDLDLQKYAINFLDLRRVIIYNFKTFLNIFFPEKLKDKFTDILSGITFNTGFFSVKMEEETDLKENAFKIMSDKLESAKKRGIQPIIIIDEIHLLKHIYINGERHLIDELFNLFIALTKVKHLAHIILATSDSYFIEEIYNSAKLAKTSRFFLLDHFDKQEVLAWLKKEAFSDDEIEKVWKYVGGCPWEITEIIEDKKQSGNIEDICDILLKNAYGRVFEFARMLVKEEKNVFDKVIKEIVEKGFFKVGYKEKNEFLDILLKKTIELDMWFYKPEEHKIFANSKSIFHAFKKLIK
jgi:uncharacterized protein